MVAEAIGTFILVFGGAGTAVLAAAALDGAPGPLADARAALHPDPALADLLRRLAAVDGVEWIRLLYAYPAYLTDEMIDAIAELPEDARRTIELREIDGLSYREIAEALGIPKGTVMSRLHYARRKLRESLRAAGFDPMAEDAEGTA